jgi:hypothetical protein
MAKLLDDEHVQQELLKWIREHGVFEFTGFTVSTQKVYSRACFDGICSRATFYKYLAAHDEFQKACDDAKHYFRQKLFAEDPELRQEYIDKLKRLGKEGFIKIKKKKTVKRNAKGEITGTEETEEESVSPTPRWAIQMMLSDIFQDK